MNPRQQLLPSESSHAEWLLRRLRMASVPLASNAQTRYELFLLDLRWEPGLYARGFKRSGAIDHIETSRSRYFCHRSLKGFKRSDAIMPFPTVTGTDYAIEGVVLQTLRRDNAFSYQEEFVKECASNRASNAQTR
jgi:hypothetical protein